MGFIRLLKDFGNRIYAKCVDVISDDSVVNHVAAVAFEYKGIFLVQVKYIPNQRAYWYARFKGTLLAKSKKDLAKMVDDRFNLNYNGIDTIVYHDSIVDDVDAWVVQYLTSIQK